MVSWELQQANKYYLQMGGEARETELLSCGDAGCVWMGMGYSTSNTVGRIA